MEVKEQVFFDGPDIFVTVHHLTMHGTNYQIGHKLAELAIERYGQSPALYAANPVYARARCVYLRRNYPIHWERVRGVAAAFGVEPDDDRYDLTTLWYNLDVPAPGCSVVYYPPATTASGRGYLSRNYDFSTGTMAEVMHMPLPPDVNAQMSPVMSEPHIMEWYPEDGGYMRRSQFMPSTLCLVRLTA